MTRLSNAVSCTLTVCLALMTFGACDAADRIHAPLTRLVHEGNSDAIQFAAGQILVRVGSLGEFVGRESLGDPNVDPPPPCHYFLDGVVHSCDAWATGTAGTHSLIVNWYGETIFNDQVTLGAGESSVKEIDLGSRVAVVSGQLAVNGVTAANHDICALANIGTWFCDRTDADGRFRFITFPGVGKIGAGEAWTAYDVPAAEVTDLGVVNAVVAASKVEVLFNGAAAPLGDDFQLCRVDLSRSGDSQSQACNSTREFPSGTWTMSVGWAGDVLGPTTVELQRGSTTVTTYDLTGVAGVAHGRITINDVPSANQYWCMVSTDRRVCGVTDADGFFTVLVPAGSPRLEVNGQVNAQKISVPAGTTSELGDINYQSAAVSVTVTYLGSPLRGYDCAATLASTTSIGDFGCAGVIAPVPEGTYTLSVRYGGVTVADETVTVTAGATLQRSYDIGGIAGTITGRPFKSGSDATYICARPDAAPNTWVCDYLNASGEFSLIVPAGTGRLSLSGVEGNAGYAAIAGQTVNVDADVEPPQILPIPDVTVEATGPNGAAVGLPTAVATDNVGVVDVSCSAPAGSMFPLGITTVTCVAHDAAGNEGRTAFEVRVMDTTPPSIAMPADIEVTATSGAGAIVTFAAPVASDVVSEVTVSCGAASGSMFPVGTTNVACTAIDASGNSASGQFSVTVREAPGATPTGSNVSITPIDQSTGEPSKASITFGNVTGSGQTTVSSSTVGQGGGPPAPANFKLGSPATLYDISTTASFTGTATICINYSNVRYPNESKLKLLHYVNGNWETLTTTSLDTQNKIICAQTTSFSPFLVAQEIYAFSGFFKPVQNTDANGNYVINEVKAGSAVPIKFSLGGDLGLGVFDVGYPRSTAVACDPAATAAGIDETVTAGGSLLTYDDVAKQYVYVWKTSSSWAGCRQLVVRLSDGTEHRATFRFK